MPPATNLACGCAAEATAAWDIMNFFVVKCLHGFVLLSGILRLRSLARFLYGRNDVWVGAATTDVAAHAFANIVIALAAGLF